MTDIVERLRSVNANKAPYANDTVRAWCHEAADEIERLRQELADMTSDYMRRHNAARDRLVEIERLREALTWYGEQARLARLIHSGGDAGRQALAEDGGRRARAALPPPPEAKP